MALWEGGGFEAVICNILIINDLFVISRCSEVLDRILGFSL
jgi:hypothetical protein